MVWFRHNTLSDLAIRQADSKWTSTKVRMSVLRQRWELIRKFRQNHCSCGHLTNPCSQHSWIQETETCLNQAISRRRVTLFRKADVLPSAQIITWTIHRNAIESRSRSLDVSTLRTSKCLNCCPCQSYKIKVGVSNPVPVWETDISDMAFSRYVIYDEATVHVINIW
jgi:hypothetical protein